MIIIKTVITLLFLTTIYGCGNYSLIEKLGPSDDNAYLQMYDGFSKEYLIITETSTGDVSSFTNTLTMISTNMSQGEEFLYARGSLIEKGKTLIKSKYGWQERFRILDSFSSNPTGATAYPEMVQYKIIEMPFIKGDTSESSILQIISNYPTTLTATPITVQLNYKTENSTLDNNINITIAGKEYVNCVKYKFTLQIQVSALENADPYNAGDPISETIVKNIYYLTPKSGIIKHIALVTKQKDNNTSSQQLITSTILD